MQRNTGAEVGSGQAAQQQQKQQQQQQHQRQQQQQQIANKTNLIYYQSVTFIPTAWRL